MRFVRSAGKVYYCLCARFTPDSLSPPPSSPPPLQARGTVWSEARSSSSMEGMAAAAAWLRKRGVRHPDFAFFLGSGTIM